MNETTQPTNQPTELQLLDPHENWAFLGWLLDERRLQFIEKVGNSRGSVARLVVGWGVGVLPVFLLLSQL